MWLFDLQEYFEFIERERIHTFETLALKYRAIGPLLTKMEGLVVHTNSGKSPRLHAYYAYWERKVFQTLTKVSGIQIHFSVHKSLKLILFLNQDGRISGPHGEWDIPMATCLLCMLGEKSFLNYDQGKQI